jgi:hypothetical protein
MSRYDDYIRWMYRGTRPNALARAQNRFSAFAFRFRISPKQVATLEVAGRSSGRIISCPIVIADYQGEAYLVSMLGERGNWIRNVRAAHGQAVLCHGNRESVQLTEVASSDRAPILRRYLAVAPGARPHFPIDRHAPIEDFEKIATDYPVFRILPRDDVVTRETSISGSSEA